jgi:hypothetical protein
MSENIYPIQLLNDIHNHFPDILYNPGRFRNVQDLLEYIRSVADRNPFTQGLQEYNDLISASSTPLSRTIPTSVQINRTTLPLNRSNINSTSIPLTRIEIPLTTGVSSSMNGVSNLISELLGMPEISMERFLNQRVIVAPSAADISRATRVERSDRVQLEMCTICQDDIALGQEMRRINYCSHYFHKDCLDTWLRTNVHCPICRHDIRESQPRAETATTTTNS